MGQLLKWSGGIIALVMIMLAIYGAIPLIKEEGSLRALKKKPALFLPLGVGISGIGTFLIVLGHLLDKKAKIGSVGGVLALSGGLLFLPMFASLIFATVIHHKKPGMYGSQEDRPLFGFIVGSGLLTVVSLFFLLDGFTYLEMITYPLVSGIKIAASFEIRFYALLILSGAIFVYFLCDSYMFKRYGRHGILENLFYVAFPAGIIGARIWYVIGNWERDGFNQNFSKIFQIWQGGLAIMGGAIFGTLAGVIFVVLRRKYLNYRWTADVIIPAILIAQAVGRWGNFFNQEVYGAVANVENWRFLSIAIRQQMTIGGQFRVPLFLIESLTNITGYLVIRYLVGQALKKWTIVGDQAASYPIWYGLTRFIMEPLRDPSYTMGMDNKWSWVWSIIFIAMGILALVANHIYHRYRQPIFHPLPEKGVVLTKKMLEEATLIADTSVDEEK